MANAREVPCKYVPGDTCTSECDFYRSSRRQDDIRQAGYYDAGVSAGAPESEVEDTVRNIAMEVPIYRAPAKDGKRPPGCKPK